MSIKSTILGSKSIRYVVQVVKRYYNRLYLMNIRHKQPVLVYQMAKVGSMSVFEALSKRGVKPIYHLHNLVSGSRIVWRDQVVFEDIIKKGKDVKIIVLIREPIARNLSRFWYSNNKNINGWSDRVDLETFTREFVEATDQNFPLNWFDIELKAATGVDIYSYTFPSCGYMIVDEGPYSILVLKTELDDSIKEEVIGLFVGLPNFQIDKRVNVSKSEKYRAFKKKIELPYRYVSNMYTSKYAQHFGYSDEIRYKWLEPIFRKELNQ